ncbi:MAG TPA: cupredoxin domain-containing protein [Acidimicrobiales bacterium]
MGTWGKHRARAAVGAALVAALVVAGCGDDGDETTTASEEGPPVSLPGEVSDRGSTDLGDATELELDLGDQYFAPTFVNAPGGATVSVTISNSGELPHTFTIDELDIDEQVNAGESATVEVTLPDSGTAVFYCRFHRAAGMQGAFVVSGSEPSGPVTTVASGGLPGY